MTTTKYDVAVIGAGPAGATVAGFVARNGLRTVLIERRKIVGEPVQCGEFLPTPHEMRDLFPDSPRAARLAKVPSHFILYRLKKMRLFSPKGRGYEFKLHANVIDRAQYDKHLVKQAIRDGAELLLETKLVARKPDNTLILRDGNGYHELSAKIVVGADGPTSTVARSIGNVYTQPDRQLSHSLQCTYDDIDIIHDSAEMYFGQTVAPGGYAWIIPRGKTSANVGLGLRSVYVPSGFTLRGIFKHFTNRHPLVAPRLRKGKIVRRVGAIIPVGGPVERTWSQNVVLVGDAAGHVMASNGGGIPTALVGGELAGHAIVSHFENGTSLSMYETAWKKEMGKVLYSALSVLRIADQVMQSDTITEICMQLARSYFLEPLIRCRLPAPVDFAAKTLVKMLQFVS